MSDDEWWQEQTCSVLELYGNVDQSIFGFNCVYLVYRVKVPRLLLKVTVDRLIWTIQQSFMVSKEYFIIVESIESSAFQELRCWEMELSVLCMCLYVTQIGGLDGHTSWYVVAQWKEAMYIAVYIGKTMYITSISYIGELQHVAREVHKNL